MKDVKFYILKNMIIRNLADKFMKGYLIAENRLQSTVH